MIGGTAVTEGEEASGEAVVEADGSEDMDVVTKTAAGGFRGGKGRESRTGLIKLSRLAFVDIHISGRIIIGRIIVG